MPTLRSAVIVLAMRLFLLTALTMLAFAANSVLNRMAVAGGAKRPAAPCGACRQVLAEFCAPEMPVFIARLKGGKVTASTVGELLPLAFAKLA